MFPKTIQAYNKNYILEEETPIPNEKQFYRVLHDAEMGSLWRTGVPEVYVISEDKATFTQALQLVSYKLNTTANPLVAEDMNKDKWRVLHDFMRAFNNGTGFNKSGDPRRDYVNNRDLTKEFPKFDKTRFCGGATVTGVEDGGYLWLETINPNSVPSFEELLPKFWLYFDAVNVTANGISRFPQGTNGSRVFVPLVSKVPVKYPLSKLVKLPLGSGRADPYKL